MDAIRKFFAALRKYHFWILLVIGAVVVMIGQFLAAGSLSEAYEKDRKAIDGAFTTVSSVTSEPAHPNDDVNAGIEKETIAQRDGVKLVWDQLYGKQKKEVLYWPKPLGQKFITEINRRKFGTELPLKMREDYQNYVKQRFQQLPEIVKASERSIEAAGLGMGRGGISPALRRPGGVGARGGGYGEDGVLVEEDYLVNWNDYGLIAQKLVWEQTPAGLKVWITQEDLWVYETLLKIIARTNEGSTGPHDAVVKDINRLEVGQDAAWSSQSQGRIEMPMAPSAGGAEERGYEAGGVAPPGGGGRGRPMEGGRGGRGEEGIGRGGYGGDGRGGAAVDPQAEAESLMEERYLDETGEPTSEATSQIKRLPILMELRMDVRELPHLIVECANATLPVEVTQVRINAGDAQGGSRGGRGGGRGGGGYSEGRGEGGGGYGYGGGSEGLGRPSPAIGRGGVSGGPVADPNVVPVTIQGIIHIFNPPDTESLETSSGAGADA